MKTLRTSYATPQNTPNRESHGSRPITPIQRRRLDFLSGLIAVLWAVMIILLILFSPACATRNTATQPKYPLHFLARDISVGGAAFLRAAVEKHGPECNALCDPVKAPSIKNAGTCVTICNSLKLAASLHAVLNASLRAACGGDAFVISSGPCVLNPDPAARAAQEADLRKALADYQGAEAKLKDAQGGGQ